MACEIVDGITLTCKQSLDLSICWTYECLLVVNVEGVQIMCSFGKLCNLLFQRRHGQVDLSFADRMIFIEWDGNRHYAGRYLTEM